MHKINCLNPISNVGLKNFTADYELVNDVNEAVFTNIDGAVIS